LFSKSDILLLLGVDVESTGFATKVILGTTCTVVVGITWWGKETFA
jgi:hypothetical protein